MIKLTVDIPVKIFFVSYRRKIHLNVFFYIIIPVLGRLSPLINVERKRNYSAIITGKKVPSSFVQIMSTSLFPSHMQHAVKHYAAR